MMLNSFPGNDSAASTTHPRNAPPSSTPFCNNHGIAVPTIQPPTVVMNPASFPGNETTRSKIHWPNAADSSTPFAASHGIAVPTIHDPIVDSKPPSLSAIHGAAVPIHPRSAPPSSTLFSAIHGAAVPTTQSANVAKNTDSFDPRFPTASLIPVKIEPKISFALPKSPVNTAASAFTVFTIGSMLTALNTPHTAFMTGNTAFPPATSAFHTVSIVSPTVRNTSTSLPVFPKMLSTISPNPCPNSPAPRFPVNRSLNNPIRFPTCFTVLPMIRPIPSTSALNGPHLLYSRTTPATSPMIAAVNRLTGAWIARNIPTSAYSNGLFRAMNSTRSANQSTSRAITGTNGTNAASTRITNESTRSGITGANATRTRMSPSPRIGTIGNNASASVTNDSANGPIIGTAATSTSINASPRSPTTGATASATSRNASANGSSACSNTGITSLDNRSNMATNGGSSIWAARPNASNTDPMTGPNSANKPPMTVPTVSITGNSGVNAAVTPANTPAIPSNTPGASEPKRRPNRSTIVPIAVPNTGRIGTRLSTIGETILASAVATGSNDLNNGPTAARTESNAGPNAGMIASPSPAVASFTSAFNARTWFGTEPAVRPKSPTAFEDCSMINAYRA